MFASRTLDDCKPLHLQGFARRRPASQGHRHRQRVDSSDPLGSGPPARGEAPRDHPDPPAPAAGRRMRGAPSYRPAENHLLLDASSASSRLRSSTPLRPGAACTSIRMTSSAPRSPPTCDSPRPRGGVFQSSPGVSRRWAMHLASVGEPGVHVEMRDHTSIPKTS